ncbi:MAG: DUF3604 domain-containing protein [Myxococcota bacterium]
MRAGRTAAAGRGRVGAGPVAGSGTGWIRLATLLVVVAGLFAPIAPATAQSCADASPLRQPFFGDVHVHTALSFDAYVFDTRNQPRDAYRFARGETVRLPPLDAFGEPTREHRLRVPLDFAAVTDHAEMLGETRLCTVDGLQLAACDAIRDGSFALAAALFGAQFSDADPQRRAFCGPDGEYCLAAAEPAFDVVRAAAAEFDDPAPSCGFTTFVGYEWTASPDGDTTHRNVLFRGSDVPALPTSYVEAQDPYALWDALDAQCAGVGGDCAAITIPHNSNLSGGRSLQPIGPTGGPITLAEALRRDAREPLVELVQHKGDSECRPGVGTATDPRCDFEKQALVPPGLDAPLSYVRNVLIAGVAQDARLGANPFRLGLIGSSDTHNAIPGSVLEDDFPGHTGADDATAVDRLSPGRIAFSPGGLMVLWAEENARASLFEAMQRREAYATSGTRPTLRFFGGFDLPAGLCSAADLVAQGYANGVPMGGELVAQGIDPAPRFVVSALMDPGSPGFPGTPLSEIEIVKGWVDAGGVVHETVVPVAGTPPGPDALDPATCTTDGSGAAVLCGEWQDPDFDPEEHAFYYARLLESPTCRWSALQCRAAGVDCSTAPPAGYAGCCDGSVPDAIQERATSSPIWVRPLPEPGRALALAWGAASLAIGARRSRSRASDRVSRRGAGLRPGAFPRRP